MANEINKKLDQLNNDLTDRKIARLGYDFFLRTTPFRSGNARRKTKLINQTAIRADYPYAGRLDLGYSKQAPDGMTGPTLEYVEKEIEKIAKKRIK